MATKGRTDCWGRPAIKETLGTEKIHPYESDWGVEKRSKFPPGCQGDLEE